MKTPFVNILPAPSRLQSFFNLPKIQWQVQGHSYYRNNHSFSHAHYNFDGRPNSCFQPLWCYFLCVHLQSCSSQYNWITVRRLFATNIEYNFVIQDDFETLVIPSPLSIYWYICASGLDLFGWNVWNTFLRKSKKRSNSNHTTTHIFFKDKMRELWTFCH